MESTVVNIRFACGLFVYLLSGYIYLLSKNIFKISVLIGRELAELRNSSRREGVLGFIYFLADSLANFHVSFPLLLFAHNCLQRYYLNKFSVDHILSPFKQLQFIQWWESK